jgi:excisionase family DNA binding protein
MMENFTPILTVPEVALYLKMSKTKVYAMIDQRQLKHVRMGRNVRVREVDLKEFIEENLVVPV